MENGQLALQAELKLWVKSFMDQDMKRIFMDAPFVDERLFAERPFDIALVPEVIFKSVYLERTLELFSKSNSRWLTLAALAAPYGMGQATSGYRIRGLVKSQRLKRIAQLMNGYSLPDQPRTKPDWDAELAYVMEGKGEDLPVEVVCDVYVENTTDHTRYAFELKAPLPNSDITKVSKEKLLKLYSMSPPQVDGAYYALPYNPYGKREDYAWGFPGRWFNMKSDRVVLIGDEFWEKIGGAGTYQAFIQAINEIAPEYKDRIYREYLGIEPQVRSVPMNLK